MTTLLRLEWIRWWRSRKLMLLCLLFIFSGVSSPLFTYYANDIIASMGDASTQALTLPDPTWQQLMVSYFKNASQIALFVAIYLIADMCQLGKNQSLRLFYRTRGQSASQIFLPKLGIGLLLGLISALCGQLSSLYVTWTFFDRLPLSDIFMAFICQFLGMSVFIFLGVFMALLFRSSFASALLLEVVIVLSGLFAGTSFDDWSPTALLSASAIFDNSDIPKTVFLISVVVLALSLLGIMNMKLRYSNEK
ncbi:hypothetical protein [Streptococcus dentiloxodontae]